jgi:quercetin dioxygenase-like cupin family protein
VSPPQPRYEELVAAIDDSPLALGTLALGAGETSPIGSAEVDTMLYAATGSGRLVRDGAERSLTERSAALVLAGEEATVEADAELTLLVATVGPDSDRHAPMGPREDAAAIDGAGADNASGARSFRILFGPHNGSTRATLFAGFIPPGRAPWHYHLYDEIVWVPDGPGRLHLGGATEELGPGAAFRLRPRQVHIVENTSPDEEMVVIGVFTPAGSPSAAYLTPDVAAEYRLLGST